MKSILLTLSIFGIFSVVLQAQEPEIDLEARKRTIPIIETRIAERNAEIVEIGNDILDLHRRIDGKLSRVVDQLANVKDSARSGYRVGKIKMDVIEGLQEAVETFRRQREGVSKELIDGRSGIPAGVAKSGIEHFDEHVEMHLDQMFKLSKSFTQDENVEKYESVGGGGYYGSASGWYGDSIGISDEWRQNRRDRTMNKQQRDDVLSALKKSMTRCEGRIGGLQSELKNADLTEVDRSMMQAELAAHVSMLEKRKAQADTLLIVEKPDTMEIGRDAARELEDAVSELIDDVQRDLRLVSSKHTQLNREQATVGRLSDNLQARKKWIEEYEAKSQIGTSANSDAIK